MILPFNWTARLTAKALCHWREGVNRTTVVPKEINDIYSK